MCFECREGAMGRARRHHFRLHSLNGRSQTTGLQLTDIRCKAKRPPGKIRFEMHDQPDTSTQTLHRLKHEHKTACALEKRFVIGRTERFLSPFVGPQLCSLSATFDFSPAGPFTFALR